MKRVIIIIIGITFSGPLMAQSNDAISKFLSTYAEDESFTVVTVTKKMFSLFAEIDPEDPEQKETMEAISKIDGLRVLALEDDSIRAPQIYNEARALIPNKEYEDLFMVRHEGMDMEFKIKEANSTIVELLLIAGGNNNFFIMSLVGDIDLNQISKLSGAMNIDGFENLELLNERESEEHN